MLSRLHAVLLTVAVCIAHATSAQQPAFEVATIKPSDPSVAYSRTGVGFTPDGIEANMATVGAIIRTAFGFERFPLADQVLNLPDWARSQPFSIRAKLSDSDREALQKLPRAQQQRFLGSALQALLVERFHLQFHTGTMQHAAYDLVIAKAGPKIKPTPADDPSLRKGPDGKIFEGVVFYGRGPVQFQQQTMSEFATFLTWQPSGPGRPVVDKTGLPGLYTFTLHYSFVVTPTGAPADTESPSLFTVLQEDLGLRLQPSTTTLPTLIVDHLDHPTAN